MARPASRRPTFGGQVAPKRSLESARVSSSGGAGGEPLDETPATPSGILENVPDDIRRKLPDEVVDELLAGARTEEEIIPCATIAAMSFRQRR